MYHRCGKTSSTVVSCPRTSGSFGRKTQVNIVNQSSLFDFPRILLFSIGIIFTVSSLLNYEFHRTLSFAREFSLSLSLVDSSTDHPVLVSQSSVFYAGRLSGKLTVQGESIRDFYSRIFNFKRRQCRVPLDLEFFCGNLDCILMYLMVGGMSQWRRLD